MPIRKSGGTRDVAAALALLVLAATRADAVPMYTAVNLIPSAAYGLNDSSQWVASWGQTTPTVYNGYGSWTGKTQPAIPRPPDGSFVPGPDSASVINNAGEIVGESNSLAFLYDNGKMYNLNKLLNIPGVALTSAYAINNAGQILATGFSSSLSDSPARYDGPQYAFLLNPIGVPGPEYAAPEPSALILMGGPAAWLGARCLRRALPR